MSGFRRFVAAVAAAVALSLAPSGHQGGRHLCSADAPSSFVLLYTNDTQGMLEDCGCHDRRLGGLARRATLVTEIRGVGGPVVLLDSGNLAEEGGRCAVVMQAMQRMGYDGVGLGLQDLLVKSDFLEAAERSGLAIVSSFPALNRLPASVRECVQVDRAGMRVTVLGLSPAPEGVFEPAFWEELSRLLRQARAQTELVVVLSQLGLERDREIARRQAEEGLIDLIVGNRDAEALEAPEIIGRTWLLPTSDKGKHVGRVDVSFTGAEPVFRWQRLEVGPPLIPDPEVQALVEAFRREEAEALRKATLSSREQLGAPTDRPSLDGWSPDYLAADQCGKCHANEYAKWRSGPHARSARTLSERQRLVPECLSCHSERFRRTKTFAADEAGVSGLQCSTCHGDGVLHSLLPKKRGRMQLPQDKPAFCRTCHDEEHDPKFEYEVRSQAIRHW